MEKATLSKLLKTRLILFLIVFCVVTANAQIKGRVFVDMNSNGIKESNEPAIQGAFIKVYRYSPEKIHKDEILKVVSDANGNYNFSPSSYPVRIKLVFEPSKYYLIPGKIFIQIPEGDLYGVNDVIIKNEGIHDFGLKYPLNFENTAK